MSELYVCTAHQSTIFAKKRTKNVKCFKNFDAFGTCFFFKKGGKLLTLDF